MGTLVCMDYMERDRMKTIGIISLICIAIGVFVAITGVATLRVEYSEPTSPTAIDPDRVKSITLYDSNGVGHEVVFHQSTVLYIEDFIDEPSRIAVKEIEPKRLIEFQYSTESNPWIDKEN